MKTITKQLDELWSLLVKKRAGMECEMCQSTKVLQSHHIYSRVSYGIRWNEENGVCLCRNHHLYFAHRKTVEFNDWVFKIRDKEKLESLKHSKPDKQGLLIYLQNFLTFAEVHTI